MKKHLKGGSEQGRISDDTKGKMPGGEVKVNPDGLGRSGGGTADGIRR